MSPAATLPEVLSSTFRSDGILKPQKPSEGIPDVSSNPSAVLHGAKDLRIENRSTKPPGPGEAQIGVKATGLCGSDLHYYAHGRNGDFVVREPMALGHEAAGVITAVGDGVSGFKVGDRVAIEAGVYCGVCRLCKIGRYNLCPNLRFASSAKTFPHLDGTLQTVMNHPARLLHKMPDTCTYEEASLVEPLSVVLHASRRAQIRAGQTVLVYGAGAVGLLACLVAKAQGATTIVAVDIDDTRLDFAVKEGFATGKHLLPKGPRPATPQESLAGAKKTVEGIFEAVAPEEDGFDVVFECTGVESCIQAAVHAARPGGKVCYIGMGSTNVMLPLSAAAFREVDLLGVFRYANTYPEALALFGAGRLAGAEKLVTTRYPLSRANEAFETLLRGKDEKGGLVVKIMIGAYDEQ